VIKDNTLFAAASENFIGNSGVDILLYLQRCYGSVSHVLS
jgi:hypothetical protein